MSQHSNSHVGVNCASRSIWLYCWMQYKQFQYFLTGIIAPASIFLWLGSLVHTVTLITSTPPFRKYIRQVLFRYTFCLSVLKKETHFQTIPFTKTINSSVQKSFVARTRRNIISATLATIVGSKNELFAHSSNYLHRSVNRKMRKMKRVSLSLPLIQYFVCCYVQMWFLNC